MKEKSSHEATRLFQEKLTEILNLYSDSPITPMLNDLVAIGTWPTPEKPQPLHPAGTVAIDTVPLPERPAKLKQLLHELIEKVDTAPLKKLIG